jgi:hypothetical protein
MHRSHVVAGALLTLALPAVLLLGRQGSDEDVEGWPREMSEGGYTVVMYQPQLETFEQNEVTARAAVSVERNEVEEPAFGVVWLTAVVETDRDERWVDVLGVRIDRAHFPGAEATHERQLADFLELEIPKWDLGMSLDRLLTALNIEEQRQRAAEGLGTDPPVILVRNEPAVLITIDGEPRLEAVESTDLERVVNTPFTLLFAPDAATYYLYADTNAWYTAPAIEGPWEVTSSVSAAVDALAPPPPEPEEPTEEEEAAGGEETAETEEVEVGPPPTIVIATEPTELIVTEGPPEYTPLAGGELLYVSNSSSDVVLEVATGRFFLVLSGRWYAGEALEGPWSYLPSDSLPPSFAQIPAESDLGHLRVYVAGTDEAQEAVMDNQIPQTAAVERDATTEVEYDGEPQFEPIEETEVEYAVNTASQVLKVGDEYYVCDEAVWFVSDSPTGPWVVAETIPQEIYTIPSTNPNYNVTYVYVYDSTPDVVYVGYYPGYTYSYVYGPTVVYGTGWWYRPWYGRYYYPRPVTWGFHVHWNPWWGWSFGFSYGAGPFRFHIGYGGWYRGGWWGPRGYRGYRYGYHRGWRSGYRAGYYAGRRDAHRRSNMYRSQANRARTTDRARASDRRQPNVARDRSNNVFADRNGNVHRRNQDGSWQRREGGSWGDRSQRPSTGAGGQTRDRAGQQPSTRQSGGGSNLSRDYQARQRGSQRTQNYNRARGSSGSRSRGGGRRR